jgi:hypothetical protein
MKSFRNLKKALSITLAGAFFSSLAACGVGTDVNQVIDDSQISALARKKSTAKLTFAIHMAADNNLYTAGLDDINEMEAGLPENANVIVLFDGARQGDSKIYKIKKDQNGYDRNIVSETLDDKGFIIPPSKEIDSGDPQVFAKFVDWVTKNYPGDVNFISIWNHGSGIFRAKDGTNEKNYPLNGSAIIQKPIKQTGSFSSLFDKTFKASNDMSGQSFASDDNGGEMHLKDLKPALDLAVRNLGRKVDIFGFDTCLMGYMETAYQLKDHANYLVASEELEPGDGWDYDGFLKSVGRSSYTAKDIATKLVETYGKSYMPGGTQSGRDITLSAIDINQLVSGLVPAINDYADELKSNLPSVKATIDKVRNSTQMFYNKDSADLGHFLSLMAKESEGRSPALNKLAAEYKKTVVAETHYGTSVSNASGLQVYFPKSSMYYNRKYDSVADIKFAENPNWGNFLKAFVGK